MRILWRRPLFCCCLAAVLLTLLAAGRLQMLRPYLWMLFALPVPILAIAFRKDLRRVFVPILCCLMSCLLLLSSHLYFDVSYASAQALVGQECEISGYVTDYKAGKESYLIKVTAVDGVPTRLEAQLEFDFSSGLRLGDHLRATVHGVDFDTIDSRDEEALLLSKGVQILFHCERAEELEVLEERSSHPILFFRTLNLRLATRLRLSVGEEAGDVAAALLLGDKSGLSGDTTLAFRRSGVSHLLALSGLHVSILVGALELLLRKLIIHKRLRMLLSSFCLLFYLALTGFAPSTVRAVLLVFSLYLAFLLWEEPDPITSLGMVLYLTLLFVPSSLIDLSLWMSYLATFGILVFAPLTLILSQSLQEKLPKLLAKVLGWALGLLLTGCAANGALLLLMSKVFGEVSLWSIPATAILSIPTTLTLISSILTLVFPALGFLPRIFAGLMIDLSTFCSDHSGMLVSMRAPILTALLILFTILLAVFAVLKIKRPLVFLAIPLCMILVFGVAIGIAKTNGGEALTDEFKIEVSDGKVSVLAIDSTTSAAAYDLREELRNAGETEIDHLIFTGYATLQPYYLSKLATSVRVFYLHLPQPKTDTELSMAMRLEQEASLHRIYVIYDAPY